MCIRDRLQYILQPLIRDIPVQVARIDTAIDTEWVLAFAAQLPMLNTEPQTLVGGILSTTGEVSRSTFEATWLPYRIRFEMLCSQLECHGLKDDPRWNRLGGANKQNAEGDTRTAVDLVEDTGPKEDNDISGRSVGSPKRNKAKTPSEKLFDIRRLLAHENKKAKVADAYELKLLRANVRNSLKRDFNKRDDQKKKWFEHLKDEFQAEVLAARQILHPPETR